MPSLNLSKSATSQLVATARSDPEFLIQLVHECRVVSAANTPATSIEIGLMLHSFSFHYPDRKLNDEQQKSVNFDWILDLNGIPADLIAVGLSRWRRGPKCAFYPKAGEIIDLIKSDIGFRTTLAERAGSVLAILGAS